MAAASDEGLFAANFRRLMAGFDAGPNRDMVENASMGGVTLLAGAIETLDAVAGNDDGLFRTLVRRELSAVLAFRDVLTPLPESDRFSKIN